MVRALQARQALLEVEGRHQTLLGTISAGRGGSPVLRSLLDVKESPAANSSLKLVNKGWQENAPTGQLRHTTADMEGEEQDVSAAAVLGLTALMAAASGLGAVPFFFVGTLSARWSALANAVACGVMLAASFDLVHEGEPYGPGLVIVGVMLGE